jgi:excisionase family DNA binding protein
MEQTPTLAEALADAARALSKAAKALERSSMNGQAEWLRLPREAPGERCPILGVSQSTIKRLIREGQLRTHRKGGVRYYSAEDARRLSKP